MEKEFFKSLKFKLIVGGIIIFFLGFFVGREYFKYELASTISNSFKDLSISNNNSKKTETKSSVVVKKGDSNIYKKDETDIKVKIALVEKIDSYTYFDEEKKPTNGNTFYKVRLESENIGKKSGFVGIYAKGSKLVTSDGFEYSGIDSVQINSNILPEGISGCVSCENNPGVKAMQDVIFEIPENKTPVSFILANSGFDNNKIKYEL